MGFMSHVSIAFFLTDRLCGVVGKENVLFSLIMTGKATKYLFLAT